MKGKGATIIIFNSENKFLLQLRDDKKGILNPNRWGLLGGRIEEGEEPIETIKREIKEEIEIELKDFDFLGEFEDEDMLDFVFYSKLNLNVNEIKLNEGQKVEYFSFEEFEKIDVVKSDKEAVEEFLKVFQD